jgi:hypothetical protein
VVIIVHLYLWCHLLRSSITTRIIYEGMCVVVYMYTLMSNVCIVCIGFLVSSSFLALYIYTFDNNSNNIIFTVSIHELKFKLQELFMRGCVW